MAKRKISVRIPEKDIYFTLYDLEGSIDSIVENLRDTEQRAQALGYTDIRVNIWNDSYDGTAAELYGRREETDEEYKARLANERLVKQRRAQAKAAEELKNSEEYQKYLELKEKFGDVPAIVQWAKS